MIKLPIGPAGRLFYHPIPTFTVGPGLIQDGKWKSAPRMEGIVMGSWQSPTPLSQLRTPGGAVGGGERVLYSHTFLLYTDPREGGQVFIRQEGRLWRVTGRSWWGPASNGLWVYWCARYEETEENADQ